MSAQDGAARSGVEGALAAAPLFAGLSPRVIRMLSERAFEKDFDRGEIVFQKGEFGTAMYLVRSGLLKVYDSAPDGTELLLTTVPPGATVGELALADGGERSASVAALHPSRVLVVRRDEFLHVLRAEGELAEPLLRYLAASLRRVTDFAADLVFLDLSARVAKLLTRLAEESGQPVRPGMRLRPLTQSELAGMVGASRQSTNKVLREFVQAGWVEQDGRQLRLIRPELLHERSMHQS